MSLFFKTQTGFRCAILLLTQVLLSPGITGINVLFFIIVWETEASGVKGFAQNHT